VSRVQQRRAGSLGGGIFKPLQRRVRAVDDPACGLAIRCGLNFEDRAWTEYITAEKR